MKCPKTAVYLRSPDGNDYWERADCLGSECSWWVEAEKTCSVTLLGKEAVYKLWDRDRPKGHMSD